MKKLLYCAATLAMAFFAGSCQQENLEPVVNGSVTYTITLPETVQTKGESGYDSYDLYYEVYKTLDPNGAELLFQNNENEPIVMEENTYELTLDLLNNQDYTILFWANKSGAIDENNQPYFDISDLRNVVIKSCASNNDDRDAFCGMDQIEGHAAGPGKTVTLTRPFAQVNLATLVNNSNYDIDVVSSLVTFKQIPSVYNVFDRSVSDEADVTFTVNTCPSGNLIEDYEGNVDADYRYVAMNYVLVPTGNIREVYYEINTKTNGSENTAITNSVYNVPVKANYRTNIIGNLLTSDAKYTVQLKPGFADTDANGNMDDSGNMEVVTDGLVKNINGDYEVTNVNGFAYMVNNLWVDNNGVANPATFYVHPGEYDFKGVQLKPVNLVSGTLKVVMDVPVLTRSALSGVVLIGLTESLINTVSEDATVVFSGITVQNFEGGNDKAALVQNNEGKVVLVGCEIVDENGAEDENTNLVDGDGQLEEVEKGDEDVDGLIYTASQLSDAFADETVESIALGADITLENTLVFPAGRNATLDLRGWELTVKEPASNYAINNHGTLTIKDSYATGEVNARGIYNGYVAEGDKITTAKLIIESGTFNAMGTNGSAAVYNYGKAVINGGKFQSNGGYGLNSQEGAEMTVNSADVRGGIYNCGTLTVAESKVYQHLSGKHCIYNWKGSVTIESGEFDSESGNELILADGQNASVVINGGEFHKTAKSWLYGAATGKEITFTINGGTHYGYVNEPEMTVDTFRPYGDPIVVTGGSYNFDVTNWCAKDYKAVKNAETAMWDVVKKVYVAKIGEDGYESLKEAVAAVEDGGTITLVADETFTENNRYNNGGYWDGLGYSGDKSFTIDLGGYTIKQNGSLNDYLIWFKNVGSKDNTITLKNGTLDAGTTAFCALCTASSHENQLTVNLENITLINNISNGATVKIRAGSVLNVNAGTKIIGKDSYLGIENWNAVVNIYDGAEIYMNGTSSYNGCLVGVGGNGTINVYGGYGKGVSGGLIAMTSGGTINAKGGEWIANTDGTYANSNKSVLVAQSDKQYNAGAGNAVINVTGGTFKGGYNCYGNAVGDAQINIKGGNFNADPRQYVVAGYEATENAGIYTVDKPAALKDLEAALAKGGNVTLTNDVTLLEPIKVENNVVVLDLNGKTITAPLFSAFEVKAGGELTVKNGKVVAYESTVRAIGGKVTVESGEYTSTGTALDSPATYRYSLDCREGGELIINGGTFKSNNGLINVGSTVTINGGKFENIVEKSMTRHFAYVSAPLTINDGEFYGKANSSAGGCFFCGAAAGGKIEIKGGKFTSLWTSGSVNRIFEVYYGGTITVTGGMFNTNGGIATFVTENTDEATKAAYPYVAK